MPVLRSGGLKYRGNGWCAVEIGHHRLCRPIIPRIIRGVTIDFVSAIRTTEADRSSRRNYWSVLRRSGSLQEFTNPDILHA